MTRPLSSRVLRTYVAAYLLFLYAPILLLPVFAFNDSPLIAFPLAGVTFRWFGTLWNTPALHQALINSLIVAASAAVLSTCLGAFAARAATRYTFPGKKGITGFIMLPLVLPEIIIAVSMLVVLSQLGLALSLWSVILGHVLICMPFSLAVLSASFNGMDPGLEEASMDLGETRPATFFRVILPLAMPGIISSLLISLTLSLDEFIIAFFLSGTQPTLPVYIWGQLRFPARLPSVMALGFLMVMASLCLLAGAEYFRRRALAASGAGKGGLL